MRTDQPGPEREKTDAPPQVHDGASFDEVKAYARAVLSGAHGPATAVNLYCLGENSDVFRMTAVTVGHAIVEAHNEDHPERPLPESAKLAMGLKMLRVKYAQAAGGI